MRVILAIFALLLANSVVLGQASPELGSGLRIDGPIKLAKVQQRSRGRSARTAKPKAEQPATEKSKAGEKSKAAEKPKIEKKTRAEKKAKAGTKPAATAESDDANAKDSKSAKSKPRDTTTASTAENTSGPSKDSLRESYLAIPAAARIAIQSDLVWTGDYNGLLDGEFSDRFADAVKAFQKRLKSKPTGVLNPHERAALAAAARPKRAEVGWRMAEDRVTGGRVGLPGKLATETSAGDTGTRWTSAQGQLQIETFRITTGATLEAVLEQQKKEPLGRRTRYSVLRPDFFVASGTQGLKKFYVRAFGKDDEVRGITVLYDQAMEGTMDSVVVAMSSAFMPFASQSVSAALAGLRSKVEYGTGVVVSASGHIVTDRSLVDDCQVIVVPGVGNAERLAEDKSGDLALIRLYGMQKLSPIGLIGDKPAGSDVTLVGIADPQAQGGAAAVSTSRAQLGAEAEPRPVQAKLAPGFSGAAALDRAGRFAGVLVQKPAVVAGPADVPQAALVARDRVINFLEANYVAPASGQPGADEAKASVVRVICVRK
jgi:hypothetical protein